jgi:hypothetical protein
MKKRNNIFFLFAILFSTSISLQAQKSNGVVNNAKSKKAKDEIARQEQAEIARKKAVEDARIAEENLKAEAVAREQAKTRFGNRFGSGTGSGRGTSDGPPGADGTRNSSGDIGRNGTERNIDDVGKLLGNINGFGNRKIAKITQCTNNSNETGKIVIEATIDSSGNIINTRFIANGSTINSESAIASATSCVRQYRFQAGSGNAIGRISITLKNKQ